ncbi:MAG: SPOR domain-containing protein [Bacteroidales bacterium]|nr:SPOR domain-containing protein [Bacteroidales bacterium]
MFRPIWLLLFVSFCSVEVNGQKYTYYELSAKNLKQITTAKKNIEKNLALEQTIEQPASKEGMLKLLSIYRSLIAEYRTIYETYSSHNYEFWTKFKGEPDEVSVALDYSSQARDVYIAALNGLNEVDRVEDLGAKLQILKETCSKLNEAIELTEKVYEIYRTTPLESDPQTKIRNRQRNDSLLKQSPSQHTKPTKELQPNIKTVSTEEIQMEGKKEEYAGNSINTPTIYEQQPVFSHGIFDDEVKYQTSTATLEKGADKTSKYWVQIAACRVPLNKWQLNELVTDTLEVVEKFVNYWYKYRVGPFDYEVARTFIKKSGIKGAFIVKD